MSIDQDSFICVDEKYRRGVAIEIYGNEYSIASANEGNDGKIYMQWIYPQGKDREPINKTIPFKISLGFKDEAISRLRELIRMIEDDGAGSNDSDRQTPNDDIPF